MSEQALYIPAVEVRGTLEPSDSLRREFVDHLINPELDSRSPESIKATLAFRTWQRRVISRHAYYAPGGEREIHGDLWVANQKLARIETAHLQLDGRIGLSTRGAFTRIALSLVTSSYTREIERALDLVPTLEFPDSDMAGPYVIYTDFANSDLAQGPNFRKGLERLHQRSVHPATQGTMYVAPGELVARDCLLPVD
jgi:hypothetical protein